MRGFKDPPENLLSGLAFHTNTDNLNQMALLQTSVTGSFNFSDEYYSHCSVTVPYLRVLCVEILLPEIIAGPSRYFFLPGLANFSRQNQI